MPSFVAVGELLVDVIAAGSGHEAEIVLRPGGSAFNAAVAAAEAGASASVVGAVGDDPPGRMILGELAARGVYADVEIVDAPTGVFLLAGGEPRVQRGASTHVALPAHIEADVVLVSGYLPEEFLREALARARARWVALDAARLSELPPGADAVFASGETAQRLTGEEPAVAVRMLGTDHRLGCVTLGAEGAVAMLDGRVESALPERVLPAGAPGSGDAFAAAFLVALASGAALTDALNAGCRAGTAALDSRR
jgi:sugar/nucleoside kinase (ribokinase family)